MLDLLPLTVSNLILGAQHDAINQAVFVIAAVLLAEKKLLCIMSCCMIINNLLLNSSMSENQVVGGPNDFLPVLTHVTIKARSPWSVIASSDHDLVKTNNNNKIGHGYLVNCVLESAYYLTNLVSAKSFIVVLNAKSLSLDAIELEESMRAARLDSKVSQVEALRAQTGRSNYPYMEAEPGELTVEDVERFPSLYKDVVTKYTHLCFGISLYNQNRTISS
ncbi:hypothetical protein NC652_031457 [Populus alba x Populus x berolinensis]|nr:hypothetical protein NC652_031457 [Populus alba x Populus x berolinensis]